MKHNKTEQLEQDLLTEVYNLILDCEIASDERDCLIKFKKAVEEKKDFSKELRKLAEELRRLAMKRLQDKKSLTPSVSQFYIKISTDGYFEKELGRGLIAMSGLALGGL